MKICPSCGASVNNTDKIEASLEVPRTASELAVLWKIHVRHVRIALCKMAVQGRVEKCGSKAGKKGKREALWVQV